MLTFKEIQIKDTANIYILDVNKNMVLYSGEKFIRGVKHPIYAYKEGLLYALGVTGVNFMWEERGWLTQEEFNLKFK